MSEMYISAAPHTYPSMTVTPDMAKDIIREHNRYNRHVSLARVTTCQPPK